jgi:hypothetical protein
VAALRSDLRNRSDSIGLDLVLPFRNRPALAASPERQIDGSGRAGDGAGVPDRRPETPARTRGRIPNYLSGAPRLPSNTERSLTRSLGRGAALGTREGRPGPTDVATQRSLTAWAIR